MIMSQTMIRRAKRMRSYGYRLKAIANALGCSVEEAQRAADAPVVFTPVSEDITTKKQSAFELPPIDREVGTAAVDFIPSFRSEQDAAAFEERERRHQASLRQSLTARMLGDPPPGFSALDKRQPPNLAEPPPISAVVKAGLSIP